MSHVLAVYPQKSTIDAVKQSEIFGCLFPVLALTCWDLKSDIARERRTMPAVYSKYIVKCFISNLQRATCG